MMRNAAFFLSMQIIFRHMPVQGEMPSWCNVSLTQWVVSECVCSTCRSEERVGGFWNSEWRCLLCPPSHSPLLFCRSVWDDLVRLTTMCVCVCVCVCKYMDQVCLSVHECVHMWDVSVSMCVCIFEGFLSNLKSGKPKIEMEHTNTIVTYFLSEFECFLFYKCT